jgi:cobalamin biosynthetic protein CobC
LNDRALASLGTAPAPAADDASPRARSTAADEGVEHGGGVDAMAARYRRSRHDWLDLSTGINPYPYPLPALPAEVWQRLPDRDLMEALAAAAARYYRVADAAAVVPAPGSQALIQWLPRLLAPERRVAVLAPTYHEHARAWAAAGHRVREIGWGEPVGGETDVVVAVNPNNPDGRSLTPEALTGLAAGRLLVVDEAFADVAPEVSLTAHAGAENLVVFRSFGKFFGLAGIRLGFAVTGAGVAATLHRALGPWPVNGPAAAIATLALADHAWIAATRERLARAAADLDRLLSGHGLRVIGGTDLFRLIVDSEAAVLFDHLARAGILVRRFAAAPRWLRIGLPNDAAATDRLAGALAAWRRGHALPG